MNRRGHAGVGRVGIVGEHCEHLLDEQRVALGGADDAIAEPWSNDPVVYQPADQILGLGVTQWGERNECRARPGCGPGRAGVEEVGAREAEEHDGGAAREAEHVLEQVEQRGLGPMDVVHDDDEGARERERLEQPAERPRGFLGRAWLVTRPDRAHDQPRCDRPALDVRQEPCELRLGLGSGDLVYDLAEWEVGDALAVGNTASDDDACLLLQRVHELPRQAGFADPGRPDDRGEPARRLSHGGVERASELVDLSVTTDEGGGDRARKRRRVRP